MKELRDEIARIIADAHSTPAISDAFVRRIVQAVADRQRAWIDDLAPCIHRRDEPDESYLQGFQNGIRMAANLVDPPSERDDATPEA